jgi:hypothetical protein
MKKIDIMRLAEKVFQQQGMIEFVDLISEDKMYTAQNVSEKKLENAEREVLDSVYRGDCDFVLFDHYKHCRNLDSAVTEYREKEDEVENDRRS